MSFSDWAVYNHGFDGYSGNPSVGTTINYFGGSDALVFSGGIGHGFDTGGDGASANVIPTTFSIGFLHGKLRTLINPVLSGPANHGLICMQSVADMEGGVGGKGYAVMLDSVTASNKLVLVRMNNGIAPSLGGSFGSSYSLLGESANSIWTEDTVYCLEIEWHVDTALGGVYVIGRFGSQTDFSDLTIFSQCLDATGHAQLTTVGESLYASLTTNSLIVAYDNTQLIQLIPI